MLAEIANEGYRFRSSFFAVNSEEGKAGFETTDLEFVDPIMLAERQRIADQKAARTTQSLSRFEAEMGFT